MTTFVPVGGAWLGAWAWRDVTRRLRARGHDVYPLSLTGLGDRVHLAAPDVNLETHISDIVNTFESEDLRDVVLVGHSYASVPVAGAADRAADRIARIVYLDTAPGDGWRWPMPTWEEISAMNGGAPSGLDQDQEHMVSARSAPHPFATYTQPLSLARPDSEPLPKLGILCSFSEAQVRQMAEAGHPWGLGMIGPEWRYVELPTGHWPMFSEPERLAGILHDAGSQ